MKINADWHREHPMPKNPSMDQRITWHEAHVQACTCAPMPGTVLAAIRERGGKQ